MSRSIAGAETSAADLVSLGEHIELRLPVARPINPVTETNWEAIGVQPDVQTEAAGALTAALEALATRRGSKTVT